MWGIQITRRITAFGVALALVWAPSTAFAQANGGGANPNLTPAGGQSAGAQGEQNTPAYSRLAPQVFGSPNYDYLGNSSDFRNGDQRNLGGPNPPRGDLMLIPRDELGDQRNSGGPNPPSSNANLLTPRAGSGDQRNVGGPSPPRGDSNLYIPRSIFGDQRNRGGPNPPRGDSNLFVPSRIFARQLNSDGSYPRRGAGALFVPRNVSGSVGLNNRNITRRERQGINRLDRQDSQRASWGYRPPNDSWSRGAEASRPTRSRFAQIRAESRGESDRDRSQFGFSQVNDEQ